MGAKSRNLSGDDCPSAPSRCCSVTVCAYSSVGVTATRAGGSGLATKLNLTQLAPGRTRAALEGVISSRNARLTTAVAAVR